MKLSSAILPILLVVAAGPLATRVARLETKTKALERQVKSLQSKVAKNVGSKSGSIKDLDRRLRAMEEKESPLSSTLGQIEAESLVKERVVRQMRDQEDIASTTRLSFLFAEAKAHIEAVDKDDGEHRWIVRFPGNLTVKDKVASGFVEVLFAPIGKSKVQDEFTLRFMRIAKVTIDGKFVYPVK